MRHAVARSLVLLGVLATAPARVARADDEAPEMVRVPLSGFRAAPAVKSARSTWVPTDPAFEEQWMSSQIGEESVVTTFQDPPYPDHAVAPETVEDLVRRLVPESGKPGWASKAVGGALEVWSSKEGGEKAKVAARFVEATMAPHLAVRATLFAGKSGDGVSRLLAVGAARLLPRRWTTVWLRQHMRRFAAGYDLQIAQESVANEPVLASVPEGEELHLRWNPGEKTSLIEVFTSATTHLPAFAVDLSGIRNVPEANSQATVQLPRVALHRAATSVAVDVSKASSMEWTWEGADGTRTLKLTIEAASPERASSEGLVGPVGVVRAAASSAPLEEGARESSLEEAVQRFQSGVADGKGSASPEVVKDTFLLCEGSKEEIDRLRSQVEASERSLVPATLELRAVVVPAATLRDDVDAGRLVVGSVIDPATASAYLKSPVHAAARLPVTAGIRSRFSCGACVVALARPDVEVAQQSSALRVATRAFFHGLSGFVRVSPAGDGFTLRVSGTLSWARPDASTFDLAYRRPLAMNSGLGSPGGVDDPAVRRVTVPVEGHGRSLFEADVSFSATDVAEGRFAVLDVAMRPGAEGAPEPVVVLGAVRKAP